ncbi:unnamed protein product, partial [Pleuronectes platessa]
LNPSIGGLSLSFRRRGSGEEVISVGARGADLLSVTSTQDKQSFIAPEPRSSREEMPAHLLESRYMALDERANASRAPPARLARKLTLAGEPGSQPQGHL